MSVSDASNPCQPAPGDQRSGDRQSGDREGVIGAAAAFGAFGLWGIAPIYFKAVAAADPLEILAHRIVWTVVLMAAVTVLIGRGAALRGIAVSWRTLGIYGLTTVLISANWLIFIWAVTNDRLLETSLGYYINPLVNVVLGMAFLGERLNRPKSAAVILATFGCLILVIAHGTVPWVSLSLALLFGFYALVRKAAKIDPVVGLLVETALMVPFALAYLIWIGTAGTGQFGASWQMTLLLVAAGAVTGVPLVLFMIGAQRLTLATMGLMQYIAPTLHFALAVAIYGEPFTTAHLVTFACIWTGLAIYSADAVRTYRRASAVLPPGTH